jgi:hypothetical protein
LQQSTSPARCLRAPAVMVFQFPCGYEAPAIFALPRPDDGSSLDSGCVAG